MSGLAWGLVVACVLLFLVWAGFSAFDGRIR